jgi:septal ring-binding cell division protein DamX
VQDPELAKDPVPDRLPEPRPSQEPARATSPLEEPEPAPPAESPPVPDEPAPPVAAPTEVAQADSRPEYARLAYQPPEPVPLTELPREFYAVQVLAMPSRDALDAFVQRHGIQDVTAARVERDGELYYVLLLGIYETAEIARRAAAALPQPFDHTMPWIRPLGSLQAAMMRANALAESAPF